MRIVSLKNAVVIPDGVKTIGNYAFSTCDSLRSIIIPESVELIGDYALHDQVNLTAIPIKNLTVYGYEGSYAQEYAEKESIKFCTITVKTTEREDGTLEITDYCGNGSSVNLPSQLYGKKVTAIAAGVFENSEYVKDITLPNTITEIADGAFDGCSPNLKLRARAGSAAEKYAKKMK